MALPAFCCAITTCSWNHCLYYFSLALGRWPQSPIHWLYAGERAQCIWQLDSYSMTVNLKLDLLMCCWQCADGVSVLLATKAHSHRLRGQVKY